MSAFITTAIKSNLDKYNTYSPFYGITLDGAHIENIKAVKVSDALHLELVNNNSLVNKVIVRFDKAGIRSAVDSFLRSIGFPVSNKIKTVFTRDSKAITTNENRIVFLP